MEVSAVVKNVSVSPRKVRLLLNVIRGKYVDDALNVLRFVSSPTARIISKLIRSVRANAENNFQMTPSDLKIVNIYADEARTLKRYKPRARGRVSPILKRSSHITVIVEEGE